VNDVQVWLCPIESLVPFDRNARTHSDDQVAQVAASIREFGWTNPILIGPDNIVIAGHARLLAAKKLGMKEVPAIMLGHLSETQRRALVIADNRLALSAGWDDELLRLELAELQNADFSLDLLGFDDDELAELLLDPEEASGGLVDDDEIPEEPAVAVTLAGDVWMLGNHRLLCGDSTHMASIEKVLAGGLADMTFCDPPYNVAYGSHMKGREREKHRITNDDLGTGFEPFLLEACRHILAVTKGAVYICMSSSELHTLQKTFVAAGGHWSTFVVWAKNTFTLGRSDYQRQYEPILYGWKEGTDHFWCGARDQGDVWFIDKPRVNEYHPTQKPIELVERAIRNSSKHRDTVLDGFGGSGSTLIGCEKTGRQARLVELEPKYCDVAIARWQNYTGKKAVLEGDGRPFAEISTERLQLTT
jgi:DNA modification methylase